MLNFINFRAGASFPHIVAVAVASLCYNACGDEPNVTSHRGSMQRSQHELMPLVLTGAPKSVIILPRENNVELREITQAFSDVVAESTGAVIPIITEDDQETFAEETTKIFVGSCRAAIELGLSISSLDEETYRILTREGEIFILGHESSPPENGNPRSQPVRWAFNRLLEDGLGVRFLWPGKLGTYVPQKTDFIVPSMDVIYQPKLLVRNLRIPLNYISKGAKEGRLLDAEKEALTWLQNHQGGRRKNINFGHAFTKWWEKYGKEHPDYFATPPQGMTSPVLEPNYPPRAVKLRLSNPDVIEQIAKEYLAAGSPDFYSVCPNDGSGYDLTPATLEWDMPSNQNHEAIWRGMDPSNLTARYVKFWNILSEKLKQYNSNVTLLSYAYSSYRFPPPDERPLSGKMIVGIVDGWDAYESWRGWRKAGADLFLRPNWGYVGAGAPIMPLDQQYDFLSYAWKNGLIGFDLDQLMGYWPTEGPSYYLIARMLTRPDLSKHEILAEYTGAFGDAGEKIREYISYWQTKSTEYGYPQLAGGTTGSRTGRYKELSDSGKISANYYHAPYAALPYLFPDQILDPAYKILEAAYAQVASTDHKAAQRVNFLKLGLDHLRLVRDTIVLGKKIESGDLSSETMAHFKNKALELEKFRSSPSVREAIWTDYITSVEDRFKAPTKTKNITKK